MKKLVIFLCLFVLVSGCKYTNMFKNDSVDLENWPPVVGESYPDLELINSDGQTVHLSDYSGKVLLIEPIGMTCPACQAFVGGHEYGGFGRVKPQKNLESIETYLTRYAEETSIADPNLTYIQLIF